MIPSRCSCSICTGRFIYIDMCARGNHILTRDILYRVSQRSSENRMTVKNLAMVFAPTLMRDKDSTRDFLDMSYKNAVIEYLITNAYELF